MTTSPIVPSSIPIVRRATSDDLPAIIALLADDELGARRENPADEAPYQRTFALIEADPNQLLVVMERNGQIVGTLQLTIIPGLSLQGAVRAQIEAVRVASGERGEGLGKQLIMWAIEQATQRGAVMVQLSSNASRTDAHRFYRGLGFDQSHVGFKLAITSATPVMPVTPALDVAAMPAGVTCDPELGICSFEGGTLPETTLASPNLSALSGLGLLRGIAGSGQS
jgi:ribosomal protein S18 acetylase RimI-like enzyme